MSTEIRDLIRQMGLANPLWGAPRIHGELLKLGIDVSQATVGRYLPWRPNAAGGALVPARQRDDIAKRVAGHSRCAVRGGLRDRRRYRDRDTVGGHHRP